MAFLLIAVFTALACAGDASIMPNPIGVTIPNGDIYVESDGSLEITCVLFGNDPEKDLKFTSDEQDVASNVFRINATAIRLHIKNPKPQSQMYRCLRGNQIVDQNFVFVAVKPSDMKCISYNYERLNCSFKSAELPSKTKYEARCMLGGVRYNNRKWTTIDNVTSLDSEGYYFILDQSTALQYRFAHGQFVLFLKITIEFSKSDKHVEYNLNATFNETKHVIPGPAADLRISAITSKTFEVAYELPKMMIDVEYSVEHMILWSCECGHRKWNNAARFDTKSKSITYTITDLPYAYALCNISVFLKVSEAEFDDMWSNNSTIEAVRTGSRAPDKPPEVFPGGFQIVRNSNQSWAVIYWREVAVELRNGPNFTYDVEVAKGKGYEKVLVNDKYAIVEHLNSSTHLTVDIRSKNSDGVSAKKSRVVLPSQEDLSVPFLESFTQWISSSGTVYLAWETSESLNITEEFAVFACEDWDQHTQLCHGHFEEVNVIQSPQENYYQIRQVFSTKTKYAVALKTTAQGWTGLLWSKCSINGYKQEGPVSEIQLSITEVGMSKIGLNWALDCKDMLVPISGYVISYCKASGKPQECVGEVQNITVEGDRTNGSCKIDNLEVDIGYLVWVSTKSPFWKEQKSKFLPYFNESKPDSALVYWTIPVGIIFLILTAVFSKKLYKKAKEIIQTSVEMPPGLQPTPDDLQTESPQSKPNLAKKLLCLNCFRSNGTKTHFKESVLAPKDIPCYIVGRSPEVPIRQTIILNKAAPQPIESDMQSKPFDDHAEEKPYVQLGAEEIESSYSPIAVIGDVDDYESSSDDVSHPYVQSGTVPDLLQLSGKRPLQQNGCSPYISHGNINMAPEGCSYVVAGDAKNHGAAELQQKRHSCPYVPLDAAQKKDEIPLPHQQTAYVTAGKPANGFCTSYVPFNSFQPGSESVALLKQQPPSNGYVPFEDLQSIAAAPEEVPLLQLPDSSRPYVVLGRSDSRGEPVAPARPYVAVGDLTGRYSDTPA